MNRYLRSTEIIDWQTPAVRERASLIAAGHAEHGQIARACFEWVRDRIKHSGDYRASVTTCRASEVLREETGWCFAKSHLLAALLRANDLPAGLCYQRLSRDEGNGFTLHGLVAVHLPDFGWYRIDARGNKPGVDAQFCPPTERLAWLGTAKGEMNFPEIWPDPAPIVVDCLRNNHGWEAVKAGLPDIPVIATAPASPLRQLTDDFERRYCTGDTPWEDPQPWQGLTRLFARFVSPGAQVLDVGCGFGTNAVRLATLGYRVLGIDISSTAIQQAERHRVAAGVACQFRCADFLAGEVGVFDVVFDRGCLHGFANAAGRACFAATVAAALPPGGLWINVSGSDDNGDSPAAVGELALPRLSLFDLAAASEPFFAAVEIAQAVYGATPSTGFRAWSAVFRRREKLEKVNCVAINVSPETMRNT